MSSRQYESLIEDVAKQPSIAVSLILYLSSLADIIDHLRNDPAALHALADDIRDRRDNVVTAVLINSKEGPVPAADFEPANGGDQDAADAAIDAATDAELTGDEVKADNAAAEPVDDPEAKADETGAEAAAAAEAAERADKTGENEFA